MEAIQSKIYVLGAGAMGSLFGGLLAEGGLQVTLIDPWREHIEAIRASGLRMVGFGGDRLIDVNAEMSVDELPPADVVFVQCKSNHSRAAITAAKGIVGPHTAVVSFQNGLGNEEVLAEVVGRRAVLGGLTAQGASIEAPGVVRNYAELPSWIGEIFCAEGTRATRLAELFTAHGLPTSASADIRLDIWKKLMANVGISAPSGIANLTIGEVMQVAEMRETAYAAIDEAVAVAQAVGVALEPAAAREVLDKIVGPGGSGANKTSLCNDLLNGRLTEIDFINGAIVKLGREHGVPTPVNATLVAAVKALEAHATTKEGQ